MTTQQILVNYWPQLYTIIAYLATLIKQYFLDGTMQKSTVTPMKFIQGIVIFLFGIYALNCGGYYSGKTWTVVIMIILQAIIGIMFIIAMFKFTTFTEKVNSKDPKPYEGSILTVLLLGWLYYCNGYFDNLIREFFVNN